MKKSPIKIPLPEREVTVTLDLSDDFIIMCEFLNITHKEALDTYLRHIKVYNYLIQEEEGANAKGTAIFKKFKDIQFKNEGLKVAKHPKHHLGPIKKIISLGMAEEGSASLKYVEIIEEWHNDIFKTV